MIARGAPLRLRSLEIAIAYNGSPPGELSNEALSDLINAMIDAVEEIQGMKLLEAVEST